METLIQVTMKGMGYNESVKPRKLLHFPQVVPLEIVVPE